MYFQVSSESLWTNRQISKSNRRLFQHLGPATTKDLQPYYVLYPGTTRSPVLELRISNQNELEQQQCQRRDRSGR